MAKRVKITSRVNPEPVKKKQPKSSSFKIGNKKPEPVKDIKPEPQKPTVKEPIIPIPEPKIEAKIYDDPTLKAPTIERDYAKANVKVTGGSEAPIPEPIITPPEIDFSSDNSNNGKSFYDELGGGDDEQANGEQEPELNKNQNREAAPSHEPQRQRSSFDFGSTAMPGMEEADAKTKKSAAEYLADVCINAYMALHELAKGYVKFDEAKMQVQAIKGKFDMDVLKIRLPMNEDGTETVTVKEFIDQINKSADETFVVSEEFKSQVRPLLIKIFVKKGWGMTPEQQLIAIVVQDAIPKVQQLFIIKAYTKQVLDVSMQILSELKQARQQPVKPTVTNAPKPHENNENENKDSEIMDVEEIADPDIEKND